MGSRDTGELRSRARGNQVTCGGRVRTMAIRASSMFNNVIVSATRAVVEMSTAKSKLFFRVVGTMREDGCRRALRRDEKGVPQTADAPRSSDRIEREAATGYPHRTDGWTAS